MPTLEISGIEVNFPFEPYPCQVNYMKGVIDSISKVTFIELDYYFNQDYLK